MAEKAATSVNAGMAMMKLTASHVNALQAREQKLEWCVKQSQGGQGQQGCCFTGFISLCAEADSVLQSVQGGA